VLKISFSVDLVNYACLQPGDVTEMMTAEMDLMNKIVRNNYFWALFYFSPLYFSRVVSFFSKELRGYGPRSAYACLCAQFAVQFY
jgi:hypothetical protein